MRISASDAAVGKLVNFREGDDVQKHALGTRSSTVSYDYDATGSVPNHLGGECMYVKATGTFIPGRLVHVDQNGLLLDIPVTGNTGRPVFVCLSNFSAINAFGWVLRSGTAPVQFSVPSTVGPVYAGTAGQATPTAAAGRQLLNATTVIAATGSFTRTAKTVNGIPAIQLSNIAGIYPGIAVSGAGIPAGATVLIIGNNGQTLTLSANATAFGQPTLTFTHTGYGIVQIEQPFIQGQIT